MAKNILIFSDGTGQAGGLTPDQRLSNVYKLFRASRVWPDNCIDPKLQVAFYDPGLGTSSDVGSVPTKLLQWLKKTLGSALGIGISRNIADCYEAILRHYEPGDRIYLFGFSRGAYTVRCVAGVLNLCGIPTAGANGAPLPRRGPAARAIAEEAVSEVYEHGAGKPREKFEDEREEQARRFRAKYQSDLEGKSNVVPYFIGVFDTVASLGAAGIRKWILRGVLGVAITCAALAVAYLISLFGTQYWWTFLFTVLTLAAFVGGSMVHSRYRVICDFPALGKSRWHLAGWKSGFYDKYLDPRVRFGRHALAIDETRRDFARVPWASKNAKPERLPGEPEWLRQIWFSGNHSDIGGSYPEDESRLSDIALQWMIEQTEELPHPIVLDKSKLNLFPDPAGMQHSEVESVRDLYPGWCPKAWRYSWPEAPRIEARGAPLHVSVHERFALASVLQHRESKPYRPETLAEDAHLVAYYRGNLAEPLVRSRSTHGALSA